MIRGSWSLHTNLNQKLYNLVSENYGFVLIAVQCLVDGVNSVFEIDAKDSRYFFKIFDRDRDIQDIQWELDAVLNFPNGSSCRVARPIKSLGGADFVKVDFGAFASLFEEARGRPIAVDRTDLFQFGTSLATLQNSLNEMPLGPPDARYFDSVALLRDTIELLESKLGVSKHLLQSLTALRSIFSKLSQLPSSWCHGDARFENCHIENGVLTFFDFENLFYGPRIYDLAKGKWCLEQIDPPNAPGLWESLLNGYRSVYTLSKLEDESIEQLVCLNEVWSLHFLAAKCELSPELWEYTDLRAQRIFSGLV